MPDVTWSVVVPWGLAAFFLVSAVGNAQRVAKAGTELVQAQADRDAAIFERTRIEDRARDLLVPLTWIWDSTDQVSERDFSAALPRDRARLYLVAAYTEVQKALLLDDVEMTDALEQARGQEPPRRMPRYPQTPPFLASVADIVGAAPYAALVDPASDLHSFTCTDGHRTTTHQSVDLAGEPCQVPSEEDPGQPCRKVLR